MSKSIVVENLSKKFLINHQGKQTNAGDPASRGFIDRITGYFGYGKESDSVEVFWALQDINFEVGHGERLAIVGRNGAGKSTLLKILSRVMSPSAGTVRIRGRLSSLLEVGTGFHPDLTGRENIYLNGALLGMKKAEVKAKFSAIVDFAEVERFLDTPVKRYSSGMYVRLAFAVSAFLEPDIVVLDEVLSVGDASFQKKSYAKMRELAAEGRTVLFVSHSMAAVKDLCESAIFLDGGRASEKTRVERAVGNYMRHAMRVEGATFPIITHEVDLLGISVGQAGRPTDTFTLNGGQAIDLRFTFHVHHNFRQFRFGFYVKTIMGEVVCRSLLADWDARYETITEGTYTLDAQIPANFLVAGDYLLEVHSSIYGEKDFFGSEAYQPFRVARSDIYNVQHDNEQPFGMVYLNPGWRLELIRE